MTAGTTAGLTLDTGALLALDHPGKAIAMQARLDETLRRGGSVCVPAGTIAQAWRSTRQVRLARLLRSRDVDVAVMTPNIARSVGLMCARCGHDDVIDVHVALCARERHHIVITSDPGDMSRIDPALPVIRVLPGGASPAPGMPGGPVPHGSGWQAVSGKARGDTVSMATITSAGTPPGGGGR